jgi:cytochrome d ubiquinol oxidase subunit II
VLTGALAVVFCGYLAAVYLAADSNRFSERPLATAFRSRALAAGLVSGALALAGLFVMRDSGLDLTRGTALVMVCVSAVAGLATLALCWQWRFGLARLTAALAVAAVVAGWAAAQAPRFLPGLTVTQAASDRSTLIALIIGVACGSAVLIPSLALLFTLFLRGQLDTPESHDSVHPEPAPAEAAASSAAGSPAARSPARAAPAGSLPPPPARLWGAAAVVGLVSGTGLLVFLDPAWAHGLGVACLVFCAVAVFRLGSSPPAP